MGFFCRGFSRILAVLLFLSGQAIGLGAASGEPSAEGDAKGGDRPAFWIDLARGEPVSFPVMMEDLAGVRVVFLGEIHRLERHHFWQRRVLEKLASGGQPLVLGLEQIERRYQPEVDRFNAGDLSFEELAEAIDWPRRWRNYTDYRGLVLLARKHGVPVLALNADAATVRQIGRKGLAALSAEERATLPERILTEDPLYRRRLDQIMRVHMAVDDARLKAIFEAQVTRDETMAATLAKFLARPENATRRALVVTGSGHISYGQGVPDRLHARLPETDSRIVLLSESGDLVLTEEELKQSRPVTVSHADLRAIGRPVGDYLHVTADAPE